MTIVRVTPQIGDTVRRVVGRRRELDATREFLGALGQGSAHLVLEGPAGIGKSTIWTAGLAMAEEQGAAVLVTRAAAGDMAVPWSGLHDLLSPIVGPTLESLPDPQRRAVEIALAQREPDPGPLDELSVRLGVLSILERSVAERPAVLAIDDVQWLDDATVGVLAFALRRLESQRLGLFATMRSAEADPIGAMGSGGAPDEPGRVLIDAVGGRLRTLPVTALAADELRELIRAESEPGLGGARIDEIARVSGGNPLYAIELARSGAIAATADLRGLVEARADAVLAPARELLAIVATAGAISWADATRLAEAPIGEHDLEATTRAGLLVARDGQIAFSHPLIESIVRAGVSEPRRQRIHRAFADAWPDHDDAARHLAAGTTQPDADVARRIDAGADRARRVGAPGGAAALYREAARLTPADDEDGLARRRIEAALAHFAAGDAAQARELLELVASDVGGPRRAEALHRLAGVVWGTDGDRAGFEAFQRALPAAAGDPAIEGDIHDTLAWLTCFFGDMPRAYEHAQIARDLAEQAGDPALLARVFDKYAQIEFQIGKGMGLGASAKAVEYELAAGAVGDAALTEAGILVWSDRLVEARQGMHRHLAQAQAAGDERMRIEVIAGLGALETRAGDWRLARRYLAEARDAAVAAGLATGQQRRGLAYLDALEGDVEGAMAVVEEQLPAMRTDGAAWAILRHLAISAAAHLASGEIETAASEMDEASALGERIGIREPGIFRIAGDAVEALVTAGRLDRASEVCELFERQSAAVGRRWGLAVTARGRALLEAAHGRLEAAVAMGRDAVSQARELEQPFELARSLLAAGTIERRAGQRREAREHLGEARSTFEAIGARTWAIRAGEELGRISGRAPAGGGLTPSEDRVAVLVAQGLTNQEVAARLFVTVRTVESNLTRIYEKLGIRSRTELARRTPGEPTAVAARWHS